MAKGKGEKLSKSKRSDEKYYCGECGAEVKDGHENCAVCHTKLDWDKIKIGLRQFG